MKGWIPLLILASLATLANFLGVREHGNSREFLLLLHDHHSTLAGSTMVGMEAEMSRKEYPWRAKS